MRSQREKCRKYFICYDAAQRKNRTLRDVLRSIVSAVLRSGFGGRHGGQIMSRVQLPTVMPKRRAWNKGRLIGQKRPLLPKQVWAIRARLELAGNLRDLALFNVAIDCKLRDCDLVRLRVTDLVSDDIRKWTALYDTLVWRWKMR